MISASEIRRRFLEYFKGKGHEVVDSSALIPKDDPSLLFTNAGMVQFKNVFLGQEVREYKRATTSQKCLRVGGKHNDLENVGRTARHHTFFEMLGNFSFGDYFKREAIGYAWEFITGELGLPKEKLYITIYTDDDEADELWQEVAGVPPERIFRLGEKDNFWSMGDTGPCGPCSEIHFDQGDSMCCGPDCGIGKCDCDRYLEIWNLVFMQYNQDETGTRTPLPKPSIDTGMGLERVAAVCQGVQSNFDIDLFQEIISFTAKLAGVQYKTDEETDTALRVIADHSRSIAFMIADGIQPSNEGRGYVLRRLIRRACRFGKLIGLDEPFLCQTTDCVVEHMGQAFPELGQTREFMVKLVRQEEERFGQTLDKGLIMLEEEIERVTKDGSKRITGDFAFKLYDTYGFPLDIVNDVAEKQSVEVDEDGYKVCMAEQKERAKAAWKGSGEAGLAGFFAALLEQGVASEFVGYDEVQANSKVLAILDEQGKTLDVLNTGQKGFVVADKTPFYGESGGQVGDTGFLLGKQGTAEVTNTLKPAAKITVHAVKMQEGSLSIGEDLSLEVDEESRMATARNHTATHLLQAALQKVLGEHVKQSGSLVGPDRLRFDFTHIQAMTHEEIAAVEAEVNKAIVSDICLDVAHMEYQDAVAKGAMALFGEKYEDTVRVVSVPGVSVELCGGTHLSATGQAGPFMVLSESGVAAGVRRIEGATGFNSLAVLNGKRHELDAIAGLLKTKSPQPGEVEAKVKALRKEIKKLNKEVEKLATQAASSGSGGDIMDNVKEIAGVKVLTAKVGAPNAKALRDIMDDVRSKLPSGVACLAADAGGKAPLILYVSKDLHDRFTAPKLIKEVAAKVGGSGGGRPDLAQAGGADPAGIPEAFATLEGLIGG